MEVTPKEILYYQSKEGKRPFLHWLEGLSIPARAKVRVRLARVSEGNLGDHKPVGHGVSEMRIHFGPGYRLYFALIGGKVILLLVGGEKGSQTKDIQLAKKYLEDYNANN